MDQTKGPQIQMPYPSSTEEAAEEQTGPGGRWKGEGRRAGDGRPPSGATSGKPQRVEAGV